MCANTAVYPVIAHHQSHYLETQGIYLLKDLVYVWATDKERSIQCVNDIAGFNNVLIESEKLQQRYIFKKPNDWCHCLIILNKDRLQIAFENFWTNNLPKRISTEFIKGTIDTNAGSKMIDKGNQVQKVNSYPVTIIEVHYINKKFLSKIKIHFS